MPNSIALGVGMARPLTWYPRLASATPCPARPASRRWRRTATAVTAPGNSDKVGHDGVVSVEEISTLGTELEFTEVSADKGFYTARLSITGRRCSR